MSNHAPSSPLSSCFRPTSPAVDHHHHHSMPPPPPPQQNSTSPNLTTTLYNTSLGLFALTWSKTLLGHSLHLHLLPADHHSTAAPTLSPSSLSTPSSSFHLHIKPFFFWNKQGSKKLHTNPESSQSIQIMWDLTRAKFGSRPDPQSGYYIAAVIGGEIALLVGDAKLANLHPPKTQSTVMRREHVFGNKLYTTKANFGGVEREIAIDCRASGDDPRLCFSVDRKRVLQIKHLKWKFRGNERVAVDGVYVQISWDVCNWVFEDDHEDGYALFMFRFEKLGFGDNRGGDELGNWAQQTCGFEYEKKKMKKKRMLMLRPPARSSSSSSSLSSASSGCSSVMEWESVEENELKEPSGFSLLVYAWKS